MRNLVKVFKAISDTNRIRILKMLEVRTLCVCEITDVLKLAPSTVSKHLSLLRGANFILAEKDGKWVYYSLNKAHNEQYVRKLLPLIRQWLPDDETIHHDREKVHKINRNMMCSA